MIKFFVDSDCDITLEKAKEYDAELISMPYIINETAYYPYKDGKSFNFKEFYDLLRTGVIPTTCAISADDYKNYFEPYFEKGYDIFYLHFSAAMTATFDCMDEAVKELLLKYPERKFYHFDLKAITIGGYYGAIDILNYAKTEKDPLKILEYANNNVGHYATYFFAESLDFFKKSGRVSGFKAFFGGIIGIRPIIYIGDDGKMTNIDKAKGRNGAFAKLMEYIDELQLDITKHKIVIGNTDYPDGVEQLKELLTEKYGNNLDIEVLSVNPTAGSHCGPNCIGVSFYAKHR